MVPPRSPTTPAPQSPVARSRGLRHLPRPSWNVLLSRGLLCCLLAGYVGAVYLVIVTRGGIAYAAVDQP